MFSNRPENQLFFQKKLAHPINSTLPFSAPRANHLNWISRQPLARCGAKDPISERLTVVGVTTPNVKNRTLAAQGKARPAGVKCVYEDLSGHKMVERLLVEDVASAQAR